VRNSLNQFTTKGLRGEAAMNQLASGRSRPGRSNAKKPDWK
jgi:hypothetical protein